MSNSAVPDTARETAPRTALFEKAFRPLFLLAAIYAIAIVPLWLLVYTGRISPPAWLSPFRWHAHEMIFGYTAAVIAGFLLTAASNWSGRVTLVGKPLLMACGLWVLGRLAFTLSPERWYALAAALELAFLPVVGVALARALIGARSRRNYPILGLIALFWVGNLILFLDHVGVLPGWSERGLGLSLNVVVLLIVMIAGRVVPMFTRNSTQRQEIQSRPRLDVAAALAMLTVAVLELLSAPALLQAAASIVTALLLVLRASRWGFRAALRDPMLWVLHVGHAWLIVGLLLEALAMLGASIAPSAALHAITVGAIGTLTLGMMARVSLGHTARLIRSSRRTTCAFVLLNLAALIRVAGGFVPVSSYVAVLVASAALWTLAFTLFVVEFTPVLLSPRIDGKSG